MSINFANICPTVWHKRTSAKRKVCNFYPLVCMVVNMGLCWKQLNGAREEAVEGNVAQCEGDWRALYN
jgi:hypothetical protein